MPVGKNLSVKQPHPSKTCKMYYLQLESYNTLAMQVQQRQQKTLVATHSTNHTLSRSTICNPKKCLYHALPFLG